MSINVNKSVRRFFLDQAALENPERTGRPTTPQKRPIAVAIGLVFKARWGISEDAFQRGTKTTVSI